MAELSSKKRSRDEEETGPGEGDCDETHETSLMFNDTLIALRMMRAQFPKMEKVAQQPFILQSQLYSSIKDRTQVDRDLESLKKEKILRLFKLNTGQDDHAIMFFEDYINHMDAAAKKLGARNQHDMEVLEWFKVHVIESKLDVSIDHQELIYVVATVQASQVLNLGNEQHMKFNKFVLLSAGGKVKDDDITLLINVGLLMDAAAKKLGARNQHDMEVLEWFKVHVIESKLDVSIDHQELFVLLSAGGKVKDDDITLLINVGLLTRQMIDPNMYWFAIPNIGSLLKALSQGRKELLSLLNRRKNKEMLLALLEKKRLRFSPLDVRFHLRDLIGSGHLKVLHTPSGMLVRVSKD